MNAYWIAAGEKCEYSHREYSHFYRFEKKFNASAGQKFTVDLCADSRYQLTVNGVLCSEGPCISSSYFRYYESVDCSSALRDGENEICVKVLWLSANDFISVSRGERAALWFDGLLVGEPLISDESWECTRDDSITFEHGPRTHRSIPDFEILGGGARRVPVPLITLYKPEPEKGSFNMWGLSEPFRLEKRPIPQMETSAPVPFAVFRRGDNFVDLDSGRYTTAKVRFAVKGTPGDTVRITYTECVYEADGEHKDVRDDPNGVIRGVYDQIRCDGTVQELAPFWYRAFRFVRVESAGGKEFSIEAAEFCDYFYPMKVSGSFCCGDETLEKMWEVSINTVRCCAHEIYVDCPYYEQQQYDMDSALEAIYTYRFASDWSLPRKCLTDLAHSQLPDGMLQANYPSTAVQVIPDFSLFWILMLRDYLLYTGDRDFVRSMTGVADRILEGFRSYSDERGMFGTTPYWPFVDWIDGWEAGVPGGGREEPLTVSNLMLSAALRAAAYIAGECGREPLAADYLSRAEKLDAAVRQYCYDEEVGLYRNTPTRKEYSEHTTVWAILSGAVSGEEAHALMARTLDPAEGVGVSRCTFPMNHYMFRALELSGFYAEKVDGILDQWRWMLDRHCTTWCESPGQPRSECHGWSAAPAYEFSAMVLGVKPLTPGYEKVSIKPFTGLCDHASGIVPTPHGPISVQWHLDEKGEAVVSASLPDGVTLV